MFRGFDFNMCMHSLPIDGVLSNKNVYLIDYIFNLTALISALNPYVYDEVFDIGKRYNDIIWCH